MGGGRALHDPRLGTREGYVGLAASATTPYPNFSVAKGYARSICSMCTCTHPPRHRLYIPPRTLGGEESLLYAPAAWRCFCDNPGGNSESRCVPPYPPCHPTYPPQRYANGGVPYMPRVTERGGARALVEIPTEFEHARTQFPSEYFGGGAFRRSTFPLPFPPKFPEALHTRCVGNPGPTDFLPTYGGIGSRFTMREARGHQMEHLTQVLRQFWDPMMSHPSFSESGTFRTPPHTLAGPITRGGPAICTQCTNCRAPAPRVAPQ